MYLHNKYTQCYYNIISAAKARSISPDYTEKHHIIPKSLGGDNSPGNLVKLSAREHFICHRLLVKMTTGVSKKKMSHAIWAMANQQNQYQQRYKVSSRTYEHLKSEKAKLLSELHKGRPGPNRGKKLSEETRLKMSLAAKGRPVSPQAREALIASRKGIAPSNKGKPMSAEQKEKMRQAALRRWASTK